MGGVVVGGAAAGLGCPWSKTARNSVICSPAIKGFDSFGVAHLSFWIYALSSRVTMDTVLRIGGAHGCKCSLQSTIFHSLKCESGGIGRRARLRIWYRK